MNKRLVWFTELFLWALLILALILGFTYSFAKSEHKNHSYYMFFKDVDGLSQGSVVRMMGYQIGYVRDVKVFNDDNIFVSFLVTQKNVYIPSGSVARVEFYGLGGSKSLEIEPPRLGDNLKNGEVIITKSPYRISDYYNWGRQIDSTIETIALSTSNMLDGYLKSEISIPFLTKSAQKFNSMLQSFIISEDDIIKNTNDRIESFNKTHKNTGSEKDISSEQKEIKTNDSNCDK